MTPVPPERSSHSGSTVVLNPWTVGAALVGLYAGLRMAFAGHNPVISIATGVLILPLGLWLAGQGLTSLLDRHGAPLLGGRRRRPSLPDGPAPEALTAAGLAEEAVDAYRQVAERDPDDPEPWIRIARVERFELGRPRRSLRALEEARKRLPGGSRDAGVVARQMAELHLGPLDSPRAAMPELARVAEALDGTPSGDWARRELEELKRRLADGELDRNEMRNPAPSKDVLHELDVLLRTRYGLIHVRTDEEDRAHSLLRHVADRRALPLFVWSPTKGLARQGFDDPVYDTADPARALRHIELGDPHALYYLRGIDRFLERDDPALPHRLADAARAMADGDGSIVITGASVHLPDELRGLTAVLQLPGPGVAEYRALLSRVLRDVASRMHVEVDMSLREQDQLLTNLRGLTLMEAEKLLTKAIVEDGRLAARDIEKVMAAKRQVIEQEGVLEYYPTETEWTEIADLAGLKDWLEQRRAVVTEPSRASEFGLAFPKGILLLGVPGCGKSLCAKAVAMDWRLPLLKLDPSNLYNKYVGESEKNFRRAMDTAERMAPLVLWIDEIEKAFASGDQDGGVSRRILGTFLSWMQDRQGEVFVVATANDVQRLPPEFMRKGRFDEIFFVDLPDAETRAAIFAIHLAGRNQDPEAFALDRLAAATEGFSGAEIEQVVVSSLFHAFSDGNDVSTEHLVTEAGQTRPLSVTMAERVESLRAWARGRTRSAHVVAGS